MGHIPLRSLRPIASVPATSRGPRLSGLLDRTRVPSSWLPMIVIQDLSFQWFAWGNHESVLGEPELEAGDCSGLLHREGKLRF